MNIKKILMPTDFSDCAKAAFDYALFLAAKHDAELHLFHAIELDGRTWADEASPYLPLEEIASRLDAIVRSEMGRLIDSCDDMVRIREVERQATAVAPTIVSYAEEVGIDVIIIGTHGHRGLRRWLIGSVTEEVVRTAGCPVLTIRDEAAAESLKDLDRILVPFDFSVDSDRSLEFAKQLAEIYGSRLDVLYVIAPVLNSGGMIGAPIIGTSLPHLTAEIEQQLARLVSEEESAVAVELHVLTGSAAPTIIDFADQQNAKLIVIATRGRSGVGRLLIGNVAERVVRAATCPVLVLRHAADSVEPSAEVDT